MQSLLSVRTQRRGIRVRHPILRDRHRPRRILALIFVQWAIYYGPFERSMRDIDFPDGTSRKPISHETCHLTIVLREFL